MTSLPQSSAHTQAAYEDLAVGMTATFAKTVTEADIVQYSEISGDTNPVHLDEAYAAKTMFGSRIAHGLLSASLLSAVLGTKLPGAGAIYISQTFKFKAPVHIDDEVTARVEVIALNPEKNIATLKTQCFVGDKLVIDGEAALLVPARS